MVQNCLLGISRELSETDGSEREKIPEGGKERQVMKHVGNAQEKA